MSLLKMAIKQIGRDTYEVFNMPGINTYSCGCRSYVFMQRNILLKMLLKDCSCKKNESNLLNGG